ncbi:MAG TPA: glutathione S-transferase, partial [Burkholderiales bacterium]|nr:glutathione S-transferase [Burkholderiales bacterium]
MQLVIGNKNYSSWSMRPWVLLRQAQIPFEEVQLKFDDSDGGLRVAGIEKFSAAGKVPVLMIDGEPVWDSLAIAETVAEMHPEKHLWPDDPVARRVARSVCAEMHSGFQALRG